LRTSIRLFCCQKEKRGKKEAHKRLKKREEPTRKGRGLSSDGLWRSRGGAAMLKVNPLSCRLTLVIEAPQNEKKRARRQKRGSSGGLGEETGRNDAPCISSFARGGKSLCGRKTKKPNRHTAALKSEYLRSGPGVAFRSVAKGA